MWPAVPTCTHTRAHTRTHTHTSTGQSFVLKTPAGLPYTEVCSAFRGLSALPHCPSEGGSLQVCVHRKGWSEAPGTPGRGGDGGWALLRFLEGSTKEMQSDSPSQANGLTCRTACPVLGSAVLQRRRQIEGNSGKSSISNEGAWGINLPEKIKGAKSTQLC